MTTNVRTETLRTPYLLLASPELGDPNFRKAVVLMGHHTDEGALGWIVNRSIDGGARALLPEELAAPLHPDTPLRIGGPIGTPGLLVLHRTLVTGIESTELASGLFVSASPDILSKLFASIPGKGIPAGLLIFGYSGWGPGQLEREMEDGSWLVLPYAEELAFPGEEETLWERGLARLGADPGNISSPPTGVN
jgi:putative transcriptional regulator